MKDIHSLFIYAIKEGQHIVMLWLLEHGAGVNQADSNGMMPIHHAALGGNAQTIQLLLQHGARVDQAGSNGRMPIHYAAFEGNVQAIQLLLIFIFLHSSLF